MSEPSKNMLFNPYLNCTFDPLFIHLIPNKLLRFSICKTQIPDLSFLHIIISLPCRRTGMSNASCSTLAHTSCRLLAFPRDLIASGTFLPLSTFLQHCTMSLINLKRPKYLNYDTYSNCISSTHLTYQSLLLT